MIFVSVGGQLPFPRLVKAVHQWAVSTKEKVIAQVGDDEGDYPAIETHAYLSGSGFLEAVSASDVFISHAGMGNIILAAEVGVPTIIVPRLASLGEHRTDHQLATANRLRSASTMLILDRLDELGAVIDLARKEGGLQRRTHGNSLKDGLRTVLSSIGR